MLSVFLFFREVSIYQHRLFWWKSEVLESTIMQPRMIFILSFLLVLSGQQVVNQPTNKTVSYSACHPSILLSGPESESNLLLRKSAHTRNLSHTSTCRNLLYLLLLLSIICALFIFTPPLFHPLLWPLALATPTSLNVAHRQTGDAAERSLGQTDSTWFLFFLDKHWRKGEEVSVIVGEGDIQRVGEVTGSTCFKQTSTNVYSESNDYLWKLLPHT